MFGRSVTLFRMFGFAVRVDSSWLVIAVLITWSLAVGFFPHTYPGLTSAEYWLMGVSGAILLFVSIIVHELAHSIVARKHGLPMKGITLFIFGGVAEMDQEPPSAKAEFLMAIAGPLTSIVVGAFFYFLSEGPAAVGPLLPWEYSLTLPGSTGSSLRSTWSQRFLSTVDASCARCCGNGKTISGRLLVLPLLSAPALECC